MVGLTTSAEGIRGSETSSCIPVSNPRHRATEAWEGSLLARRQVGGAVGENVRCDAGTRGPPRVAVKSSRTAITWHLDASYCTRPSIPGMVCMVSWSKGKNSKVHQGWEDCGDKYEVRRTHKTRYGVQKYLLCGTAAGNGEGTLQVSSPDQLGQSRPRDPSFGSLRAIPFSNWLANRFRILPSRSLF